MKAVLAGCSGSGFLKYFSIFNPVELPVSSFPEPRNRLFTGRSHEDLILFPYFRKHGLLAAFVEFEQHVVKNEDRVFAREEPFTMRDALF